MSREERIAENEAFCRDLNERKAEWLSGGLQGQVFDASAGRSIAASAYNYPDGNGKRFARDRSASLSRPGTQPSMLNRALKRWSRNTNTSGLSKSAARRVT